MILPVFVSWASDLMVGEYGFDDSVKNHILNISYNDLRSNMINEKKRNVYYPLNN